MAENDTWNQIVNSMVISLIITSLWILTQANMDLFEEDSQDSFEFTYMDNDNDRDISPGDSVTLEGGFNSSVGKESFIFQMRTIGIFTLIFGLAMSYQRFEIGTKKTE